MTHPSEKVTVPPESGLKSVLGRNLEALIEHRRAEERRQTLEDRIVSRATRCIGSIGGNTGPFRGRRGRRRWRRTLAP